MSKNHYYYSLLATMLLFSSCRVNHYLYAPVAPQTPMLNSKGEMNITGMYAIGGLAHSNDSGYNNGYDVQAAYAITHHLAITGAFSHRHEKDNYENANPYPLSTKKFPANVWYNRNTTQLGLGYFTSIDSDNEVFFDLYGGYGFGKYRLHETGIGFNGNYDMYHTTSISQFYLQPGFHFNVSDMSQVATSLRVTTANYYHIMSDYPAPLEDTLHMSTIRNTTFVFLEPSLTVRLWIPHAPWLKLETQLSTSLKLNNKAFNYRKSYFSVGLSFDLSKINEHSNYKKKNKNPRVIADPRF